MAGKRKLAHVSAGNNSASKQQQSNGTNAHPAKKHKHGVPAKKAKAAAPVVVNVAKSANSNWLALKAKIQQADKPKSGAGGDKTKKHDLDVRAHKQKTRDAKQQQRKQQRTAEWIDNASILAMDCEMVGVGLSGKTSVLARCSIVDYDGNVVYDKHVRPVEKVTGAYFRDGEDGSCSCLRSS